jgi:hypothetical protein
VGLDQNGVLHINVLSLCFNEAFENGGVQFVEGVCVGISGERWVEGDGGAGGWGAVVHRCKRQNDVVISGGVVGD